MEAAVKIEKIGAENPIRIIEELRCSLEAKDHQIKLLEEKINVTVRASTGLTL